MWSIVLMLFEGEQTPIKEKNSIFYIIYKWKFMFPVSPRHFVLFVSQNRFEKRKTESKKKVEIDEPIDDLWREIKERKNDEARFLISVHSNTS